jgi:hypothetical protein
MQPFQAFTKIILLISLSVWLSACGGGGGGGDDAVSFPTPTLPAGAVKIDAMNAEAIATSVLDFTVVLFSISLKTEGPPSIPQVIKLLTDQVTKRNRYLGSVAAGKTEDVSAFFCFTGTAIDTFTENTNSVSGQIKFSNCDIGGGMILNGTFPYEGSWNNTTLDYNFHFGGSLTFDFGTDLVTVVMNFFESGNDGTGDYSLTPSFSLDGIPDESYLVTTVQPLMGNFFSDVLTSGELNVEGADNTQLCMTVTAINTVTVEFDDGLGVGCVPLPPPLDIVI